MRLERISIENYKVFRKTTINNLPKMAVFLGANGSGKTTLIDVFHFLSDCLHDNVNTAINKRGGFQELIPRNAPTTEKIRFEIILRLAPTAGNEPLQLSYSIEIAYKDGIAFISKETVRHINKQNNSPWSLLDFSIGKGYAAKHNINGDVIEHVGRPSDYKLVSPDVLAINGLGQFEAYPLLNAIRTLLARLHISNLIIESMQKPSGAGISDHLSSTGDNLAQVTKYLYDHHKETFDSILEKLSRRIPGINKVEAKETEEGTVLLRFQDQNFKNPFLSRFVSDGTIKMFAYLILLHDPHPHPLLCIEEPENFLHPDLLMQLCEEIREYSERGGQVFVSSHSPDFVNGARVEELYFLVKKDGFTRIKAAQDDTVVVDLAKENQLGWLWRNHYINGANL